MIVGVVGASSLVGELVVERLQARRIKTVAFSRISRSSDVITWRRLDDQSAPDEPIENWIYVAHLWTIPEHFTTMKRLGAKRIVGISSTSLFTKSASVSTAQEAATIEDLKRSEQAFGAFSDSQFISWLILRPTLIYGFGKDKNIVEIARLIRYFGFFPLFGKANGARQPIHATDVAEASIQALLSDKNGLSYNIAGAEVLSYSEMVRRVFVAMGRRPITPKIPLPLFKAACSVLRLIPRYANWTPAMAERMNRDMSFDISEARRDFGFAPRPFRVDQADLSP